MEYTPSHGAKESKEAGGSGTHTEMVSDTNSIRSMFNAPQTQAH